MPEKPNRTSGQLGGSPKSARRDLSGTQLGDFLLLRKLGAGGMGEVYLAQQISLKRKVALKVLRENLTSDETARKRFNVEAEAAAKLTHAGIVQIYSYGEHNDVAFMALEYVQGMNLREFVARKGPVTTQFAIRVMEQVAAAIHHAGEAGIVHRDIKPDNILLTRQGEVKVADFGLARLRTADTVNLTQTGMTIGTPLYMSPEQVEGKSLDIRSDLYSLGVTGYFMLAGHPPFRGETALAVAVQHIRGEAEPLDKLRPDLPLELCHIVQKLMAKDPNQRYQTGRQVLRDLQKLRGERGGAAEQLEDARARATASALGTALPARQSPPTAGALSRLAQAIRYRKTLFAATLVTGFVAGASYGWYRRAPNLEASRVSMRQPPPPVRWEDIPEQKSAEAQYKYANWSDPHSAEAAWLAVIHRWSLEPDWVLPARMQLGKYYLDERALAKAAAHFADMVASADEQTKLAGVIGHAALLSLQDRPSESQTLLWETVQESAIGSDPKSLAQRMMLGMVLWTLERNYRNLGIDWDPDIRSWAERRIQRFGPLPSVRPAERGAGPPGRSTNGKRE